MIRTHDTPGMNRMLWPTELRRQMVAGVGFEPHDLRVMSPTSYQAALPRDIFTAKKGIGAGDRSRTGTMLSHHGILSPGRLPIPPHRQKHLRARSNTAATGFFLTTPLL